MNEKVTSTNSNITPFFTKWILSFLPLKNLTWLIQAICRQTKIILTKDIYTNNSNFNLVKQNAPINPVKISVKSGYF